MNSEQIYDPGWSRDNNHGIIIQWLTNQLHSNFKKIVLVVPFLNHTNIMNTKVTADTFTYFINIFIILLFLKIQPLRRWKRVKTFVWKIGFLELINLKLFFYENKKKCVSGLFKTYPKECNGTSKLVWENPNEWSDMLKTWYEYITYEIRKHV